MLHEENQKWWATLGAIAAGTTFAYIACRRYGLFQSGNVLPYYKMQCAGLSGGKLQMSDAAFAVAIEDGFFEIKLPPAWRKHLDVLRDFSKRFHQQDEFGGVFNDTHQEIITDPAEGYMVDNHRGKGESQNQVERFSLKRTDNSDHWQYYPLAVREAASAMSEIARIVLCDTLARIGIDPRLWGKATGDSHEHCGSDYMLFNHYRAELQIQGLKEHQDWSNVTVLVTELAKSRNALQACIGDTWYRLAASSDDHIIINFGLTLALFTALLPKGKRVNASWHRVVHQQQERTSCALFKDHGFHRSIYQLQPDLQTLKTLYPDFSAFAAAASKKTYDMDDEQKAVEFNMPAGK